MVGTGGLYFVSKFALRDYVLLPGGKNKKSHFINVKDKSLKASKYSEGREMNTIQDSIEVRAKK